MEKKINNKNELSSLDAHRKMYERRLEQRHIREGKTIKELLNIANNPKIYRKALKRL